jgi:hypothetical protein
MCVCVIASHSNARALSQESTHTHHVTIFLGETRFLVHYPRLKFTQTLTEAAAAEKDENSFTLRQSVRLRNEAHESRL